MALSYPGARFGAFAPYGYGFGYPGPAFYGGYPGFGYGFGYPAIPPIATAMAYGGLGGLRRHGGTYTQQFLTTGLPTDQEVTEMIYDQMDADPLIPYDADINVDVDAGVVTLTGTVPDKAAKHAAGNDAWWVPGVDDVSNQIAVSGRHRYRVRQRAEGGATQQPQR